jgi:hypothetical protein
MDLPALSSTTVGQGAQLIAGAVGNLIDQQRQFREDDNTRRAADAKTPDKFLGSTVQPLLRLAGVASSADLADFWPEISSITKAQQLGVVQRALDEAMELCMPGGYRTHIVTPSLAKKITNLDFRMSNPDDLSTGIQPFILVQTTAAERQQAQTLVNIFDTVMHGASASVTDAQLLVANDQALIPVTTPQARTCLTFLQAIICLAFGSYHPWRLALARFLQEYAAREVDLEVVQPRDPQYRALVPALIVRWVQLRWTSWLANQWYSPVDVPIPNLNELFLQIELHAPWEPTLPAQYL